MSLILLCMLLLDGRFVITDRGPGFVVTEHGAPFIITDRQEMAKPIAAPVPVQSPKRKLRMYTADWCGPCRDWKQNELRKIQEAGFEVEFVDISSTRNTGVSRIPTFHVVEADGTIVHRFSAGSWAASSLLSKLQDKPQQPGTARETAKKASTPARNPGLYTGVPGSSHQNRTTLINHLLYESIHAGRHTWEELNSMSDDALCDLHDAEHTAAGHTLRRGFWQK